MTTIVRNIASGPCIMLPFAQDAVAASQTDVQLVTPGETTTPLVVGYEAPWDGQIVAVAYTLDTAGSAGTLTVGATIDGTEDADTTISVGTSAAGYLRVPRGKARFSAGASIGAEITTDATWDGTASDLGVQVYVVYNLTGI